MSLRASQLKQIQLKNKTFPRPFHSPAASVAVVPGSCWTTSSTKAPGASLFIRRLGIWLAAMTLCRLFIPLSVHLLFGHPLPWQCIAHVLLRLDCRQCLPTLSLCLTLPGQLSHSWLSPGSRRNFRSWQL